MISLENNKLKAIIEKSMEAAETNNSEKTSEQMLVQANQKQKELENKLTFIFEKFESGIYTDEMFLQRKAAIEKEIADIKKLKQELSMTFEVKEKDVNEFRVNISDVVKFYKESKSRGLKNEKLRSIFDFIVLEMTEKRRGPIPAKFNIYPVLRIRV
ncbi:hypothetical protein [Bacillus altitudinis]|uniref:hypothetical protein n=1 Tax=Bacillus altitudinis TaxID=293387 RepID=UPI002357AB6B|nr:hypothetical protein [Bacillus altitudinis]